MLYSLLGSRMSAFFAVLTVQKHAKQQNNHAKRLNHLLSIDVGHLGSQFEAKGSGLSSQCGPWLFLKEHLPKKIPQKHTLV